MILSPKDLLQIALLVAFAVLFLLRNKYPSFGKPYRILMLGLVGLAFTAHFNFFSFHPGGTHLHNLEMYHYYMGSKYYSEVGYTKLYEASLIADSEDDRYFKPDLLLRSLENYEMVPRKKILEKKSEIISRFTPDRWNEFRKDLAVFRATAPTNWGLKFGYGDHGYNGSPLVTGLMSLVSSQPFYDTNTFIHGAAWLDIILVLFCALFLAVFLDADAALLFLFFTAINPLNDYQMIGGGYLRYLTFVSLAFGIARYRMKRFVSSGAFFAVASLLRIFPILCVACLFISQMLKKDRGQILKSPLVFYVSFLLTALSLVLVTSTIQDPQHRNPWTSFKKQIEVHYRDLSLNRVGLKTIFSFSNENNIQKVYQSWPNGKKLDWAVENQKTFESRKIFYFGTCAVLLIGLFFFLWRARGAEPFLGGILLAFMFLTLSHYYYYILSLVPLLFRENKKYTLATAAFFYILIFVTAFPQIGGIVDCRFFVISLAILIFLLSIVAITLVSQPEREDEPRE